MAKDMIYFDKLENRYHIKGKLKTKGALHIGSGLGDDKTDARVMKIDGNPYLPGSSLKGYIRSDLERMVATLADKTGFNYDTCLLNKDYATKGVECATVDRDLSKELQKAKEKNSNDYFHKLSNSLCSVCKLFGSKEMAAKAKITDAFLSDSSRNKVKTAIRDGIAIDRDTGTTKKGAKYDYEVVEAGAEFEFELIAENLVAGELALIALALLDLIKGKASIGGNTSKGLGQVELNLTEIKYFADANGLLDYISSGEMEVETEAEEFLQSKLRELMDGVS